jgi:hypothetical protein
VHQPEIICQEPWIVFPGNCQGRHARETGPRGCQLVTVNDALAVQSVDWHALDVVRWAMPRVDLTGADSEAEALLRLRASLSQAVSAAENRMLAVRMVLAGSTALHGSLHRDAQRWRAEVLACAQDHGNEAVWIERLHLATAPLYNAVELAERDALTRIVVETLDQARNQFEALPAEIEELLGLLPGEVRNELEEEWSPDQRGAVLNDVRAIILDALGAKGGAAT